MKDMKMKTKLIVGFAIPILLTLFNIIISKINRNGQVSFGNFFRDGGLIFDIINNLAVFVNQIAKFIVVVFHHLDVFNASHCDFFRRRAG